MEKERGEKHLLQLHREKERTSLQKPSEKDPAQRKPVLNQSPICMKA